VAFNYEVPGFGSDTVMKTVCRLNASSLANMQDLVESQVSTTWFSRENRRRYRQGRLPLRSIFYEPQYFAHSTHQLRHDEQRLSISQQRALVRVRTMPPCLSLLCYLLAKSGKSFVHRRNFNPPVHDWVGQIHRGGRLTLVASVPLFWPDS
jgi:hypothetical protein